MAFFRSYQCPDCGGVFKFLHHPAESPPPDACELCHASMVEPEPVFVAQAPRIGTTRGERLDQVFRQLEIASEARAELMAQAGGGSVADYAHTKLTNFNDSRHAGDVAAITPPTPVQGFMMNSGAGGGYKPLGGAEPSEYAAQTKSGPFPYAGAQASDRVRGMHSRVAAAVQREGQINKKP
jgi:hypothetical protein